ncbi:rhodanese-like domain-containing protein [Pediococcus stilesii]|uniref:Rhodanese-like domain-containing protein n=1 Tax=Pediococcus stilesii TaxID=331679 RepID=A0A0R2L298_9LACO|nr:rhodanese-like domain-containing protein [Pediococcus stilesii]KRN92676.1 rhodanese-related sulfurtransferase [Pediococcus stilesii]TLQ04658.1 rhodanese-like domain-containing protein [Pediococcus stilesii]
MVAAAASNSASFWINTVLIILIIAYLVYQLYLYWKRGKISTLLDDDEFRAGMRKAQIIDVREKKEFDAGHILGARNIPYSQMKTRTQELRSDLPVYLYDQGRTFSGRAAMLLSKKGFDKLYILKNGYQRWTGKTKKTKY